MGRDVVFPGHDRNRTATIAFERGDDGERGVMTTGAPLFGDLESTRERLREMARQAELRSQQFARVRDDIQALTVTEQSARGAVRATVQASGALSDLRMTDEVSRMRPNQIAAEVLACIRRAQARLADRVRDVVTENVPGDDPAGRRIVDQYRAQFPEPEPEPQPAPAGAMRLVPEETEQPPPVRPVRRPRPGPDDDDSWEDQTFLRR